MNGSNQERALGRALYANGYQLIRGPSSGSATKRPCPDIAAGRETDDGENEILAIELKTSSDDREYVTKREIDELRTWAQAFGARVVLGFRWSGDATFYLYDADDVPESKGDGDDETRVMRRDSKGDAFLAVREDD